MFGTLTLLSALTSVVLAQSSSSSAAPGAATQSPLIPSSISSQCSTFLSNLNTDPTLKTCLNALNAATSAFSPGSNSTVTKTTVTSALSSLCADSVSSACPETYIRAQITNFWTSCNDELKNKNTGVTRLYDALYTTYPMRTAVCSKDDSGAYCVFASPSSGATSSNLPQLLASLYITTTSSLARRAQTPIVPNMSVYREKSLQFLSLSSNLDATTLCTTCCRQVLTAYMTFESDSIYGPGLANSQLLSTQSDLYNAVESKCPSGFLNGAVQAAGGLSSGGILSSGALPTAVPEQTTLVALFIGLASMAISFIL